MRAFQDFLLSTFAPGSFCNRKQGKNELLQKDLTNMLRIQKLKK